MCRFCFLNIPMFSQENMKIFWIFLKIGSILYGSGYVLFAFLDSELVAKGMLTGPSWLTRLQLVSSHRDQCSRSVTFHRMANERAQGAILATIAVIPSFICLRCTD